MSKTVLYYFTATGNTLALARELAGNLNDVELIAMADALRNNNFPKAETIGIFFPVYMAGIPLIVRRFIAKADFTDSEYLFSFANFGGMSGVAHRQVDKYLKLRGTKLNSSFGLKMPDNYIPFFKVPDSDANKECYDEASQKLPKIAKFISNKVDTGVENAGILSFLFASVYALGSRFIPKMDKKFSVNDNCNSCASCVKVCPVDNIVMDNSKPKWLHHCEHCLACIHWCPQQAISFKKKLWQYHNPNVTLKDMMHSTD